MADLTPQQVQTQAYKDLLKSYGVPVNTDYTGSYWDVTANVTGAMVAEVSQTVDQLVQGNDLFHANSFMLDAFLKCYGLGARKSGFIATGNITLTETSGHFPTTVSSGTQVYIGNLYYTTTSTVNVVDHTTQIPVEAVAIGAEYNIVSGIPMQSAISGFNVISGGINGGSGRETDAEAMQRIYLSLAFRKTDSMLSDYDLQMLQFVNYVTSNVKFDEVTLVVPIGIDIFASNTPQDYVVASRSSEPVSIDLSDDQITSLNQYFFNQRSTNSVVKIGTLHTQVIDSGVFTVHISTVNNVSLTGDQVIELQQLTRQSLLEFQGAILAQHSLIPTYPAYVSSFYFENFLPITKTAPLMDCLYFNISIVQP